VHAVIFSQASLPQFLEETSPVPVLKVLMHRAGRAKFARQCFPLNARAQNVNNGRKDLPCSHRLTPSSSFALIFPPRLALAYRNQRLNLAP